MRGYSKGYKEAKKWNRFRAEKSRAYRYLSNEHSYNPKRVKDYERTGIIQVNLIET